MLAELPLSWLVFVGAAALAAVRWAHLLWRDRQREPQRQALREDLSQLLEASGLPDGFRRRPIPDTVDDRRLIAVHETEPRQLLPRFPGEETARTVLFADGRVEWFTESAFEKLLMGDNILRQRLNLPVLDANGAQEETADD